MPVEPLKLKPLESEMSDDKKVFKYVKMAIGRKQNIISRADQHRKS